MTELHCHGIHIVRQDGSIVQANMFDEISNRYRIDNRDNHIINKQATILQYINVYHLQSEGVSWLLS